jgi:diacylglycerol kinase (ATP)
VGGGFLLNPEATPYDGLLDLIVVKPLGIWKVAQYIPKVLRGRHQGLPELIQRRVSTMTVAREDGKPISFEMDGERVPYLANQLVIDVEPRAFNVLVGQGGIE